MNRFRRFTSAESNRQVYIDPAHVSAVLADGSNYCVTLIVEGQPVRVLATNGDPEYFILAHLTEAAP